MHAMAVTDMYVVLTVHTVALFHVSHSVASSSPSCVADEHESGTKVNSMNIMWRK